MPEDTGFYIDDVCIPHSWYPIEAGRHFQIVVSYDAIVHLATIDTGNCSVVNLGVATVAAMNKNINVFKRSVRDRILSVKLLRQNVYTRIRI